MGFWDGSGQEAGRELTGRCGFRLMPTDEMEDRPATATVETAAAGHGLLVRYTWEHPDDGPQSGVLLVASPDEDGGVHATWLDSWHQQPYPMLLTGRAAGSGQDGPSARLAGTYGETWGWEIDVDLTDGARILMRNVMPADALPPEEADQAGSYVVMDLRAGR